jgi:HEPN domain-containing protein
VAKGKRPPPCSLEFYRVAVQRLGEAQFLLDEGRFTTAAVYLGGYAVECALKAVLLANTPRKKHQEVKATFRGKIAHNFDWLQSQLVKRRVVIPDEVLRHLTSVHWWGTDLRYEPGPLEHRRAIRFLASVELIVEWARRSS